MEGRISQVNFVAVRGEGSLALFKEDYRGAGGRWSVFY